MDYFLYISISCDDNKAETYSDYFVKQDPIGRQDGEIDDIWYGDEEVVDFILLPHPSIEPTLSILKTFSQKACNETIILLEGEKKSSKGKKYTITMGEASIEDISKKEMKEVIDDKFHGDIE